MEIRKK